MINPQMNCMDFDILDILRFCRKNIIFNTRKRNFSVISLRLSGHTTFLFNGEKTLAAPTNCIYIPANIEYSQHSDNEEVICIHIKTNENFFDRITEFECVTPKIKEYFIALNNLWKNKDSGYILKCKSLVYDILYDIYTFSLNKYISQPQKLISDSVAYMQNHFAEFDFSINKAISLSNLSPAYFRRIFKSIYNATPNEYITALKIDYAKTLLTGNCCSVKEISEKCGFSEEKYFYSVFKKITGTTPYKWRHF